MVGGTIFLSQTQLSFRRMLTCILIRSYPRLKKLPPAKQMLRPHWPHSKEEPYKVLYGFNLGPKLKPYKTLYGSSLESSKTVLMRNHGIYFMK